MSPPLRAVAFPPGVSWEHAPFFRVCCRAPSPQGTFLDFWDQSVHCCAHCEGPWLLLTSPPVGAVASGSVPLKGAHKTLCFQWPLWVESPSACMDAPVSQERVRLVLTPQYRVLRGWELSFGFFVFLAHCRYMVVWGIDCQVFFPFFPL